MSSPHLSLSHHYDILTQFNHQVKAQLEFAASEDSAASAGASAAGASAAGSASALGSASISNEVYAAPLPLASYSGK